MKCQCCAYSAGLTRLIGIFILAISLMGCEARLDLRGVEKESTRPVRRFDQLLSVAKHDHTLVVVGGAGTILVSLDGAMQWTRHNLPGAPTLIEVTSCPDGSFAALDAGRKVWVSVDQGDTWQPKEIDTQESVTTITCSPNNQLWVGGGFTSILNSVDQGETWSSNSLDEDAILTNIQFVDDQFGVIVGEFGMTVYSNDGGNSWKAGAKLPNDFYPQAALFLDREQGFVVGLSGKILKTIDGGQTWEYETSGTEAPLYGLAHRGKEIYVVGEGGEMLQRKDALWERVEHGKPVRSYLRSALPVDDEQILLVGGAGSLFLMSKQN